jgi:hypothetical protein
MNQQVASVWLLFWVVFTGLHYFGGLVPAGTAEGVIAVCQSNVDSLNGLLSFILGLFLLLSLERWWALRRLLTSFASSVSNIALLLSISLEEDRGVLLRSRTEGGLGRRDIAGVQKLFMRWALLSHALVYGYL